jgi:hypothetical protein
MNPDEANTLMQVMSNKINQLTQQNIMLESKVMYLNSVVQQLQSSSEKVNDGGTFDETPPVKQNNVKTKQQGAT